MNYKVIDTSCRPKRWKVESIRFPGSNNSWTEYYKTRLEAQLETDKRNEYQTTPPTSFNH